MKVLSHVDIKNLNIPPSVCYKWVCDMIRDKNTSILPPKISMKPRDTVFCNIMPSIIRCEDGKKVGGLKLVTRYPERNPGLDSKILLMDADNGEVTAFMDGNWITAMRTGAVAAHSIELLAKQNYHTIGMIGLGNAARATLLVLSDIIGPRTIKVKLMKHKDQELDFIRRFEYAKNISFEVVDTYEDLMDDSDVIISAVTYVDHDFCDESHYKKGVLLVPIHTRGFANCDSCFDKVFADDRGHVCHFDKFNEFRYFAETSDVVNGRSPGRENDDERIIAYNIGVSIHDICFAYNIFRLSADSKVTDLDFHSPTDKFWI